MEIFALIVAAGSGQRLGGEMPKQYRQINGKPVLRWTLEAFSNTKKISKIMLVVNPEHEAWYLEIIKDLPQVGVVHGGQTRQDSVRNGLEALMQQADSSNSSGVLIHDAARPFVTAKIIDAVILALEQGARAVDVMVDMPDTLKSKAPPHHPVDRDSFYATQTPQAFKLLDILALHQKYMGHQCTDDVSLAVMVGWDVQLVAGARCNFKITTIEDLYFAQIYANLLTVRENA
jgi:2-C-methyl-D-erythritol 4-phosphate cytidylyltransferase/2-C-methyl-D-erythritol 2,4-cyclodiphosphate synthase